MVTKGWVCTVTNRGYRAVGILATGTPSITGRCTIDFTSIGYSTGLQRTMAVSISYDI